MSIQTSMKVRLEDNVHIKLQRTEEVVTLSVDLHDWEPERYLTRDDMIQIRDWFSSQIKTMPRED